MAVEGCWVRGMREEEWKLVPVYWSGFWFVIRET